MLKYIKATDALHNYTLDGTKILRESWTEHYTSMGNVVSTDYYIEPIYNNDDSVAGINFCGDVYFFNKNLQGDIIEIVSGFSGKTVAKYSYDAWGKCTVDSDSINTLIAERNPFRYRGYYYDSEIQMYYLQSRYYDPNTGRFINGDEATVINIINNQYENNLFSYCQNAPNSYVDPHGYLRVKTWIVSTALDVLFALLNHIMVAGYISLSASIWILARFPFTRKVALNLVKTKVVPVFVRGFFNTALTCLRKVLQTSGRIGKEFAKGWTSDKAVSLINKYLKSRFLDFVSSIRTWGGIISLVFDMLDGKWDGYITVK